MWFSVPTTCIDYIARSPEAGCALARIHHAEWILNHTTLLNKRRTNWEDGGYSVNVEGQNAFRLRGTSATLAGKPDLIAQRDATAVIVDVKTGHESASHVVQVVIYLYAIPRALERYQFIQNLGALIRRLAADKPPTRVPSRQECRFCDISALDCPERMDVGSEPEGATTSDF